MLIRSQNKKVLVNLNNTASVCIVLKEIKAMYSAVNELDCLTDTLGTYSTEEKAIKVLDDIQEKYAQNLAYPSYQNAVFTMPQKNEV